MFLNTVGGLGSPWWQSGGAHCFSSEPESDAAAIAGVMESIVFLLETNIREIELRLGPAERLVVTGGLAAVGPLLQKLADCSGRSVQRAAVREATSTGLAWLLAGLPDDWPVAESENEFAPVANAPLTARFAEWSARMPALD